MYPRVGETFGPYLIEAPLGEGGMATAVYRARDTRLAREVAIKVLPDIGSVDQDSIARFEREARVARMLNHPNVATIYDVGELEGTAFIVSELLDGETLGTRLRHGAIPEQTGIEILVQVADGLAAAHSMGIVHRDLKPDNIFVTRDGLVKILDFGLAKLVPQLDWAETAVVSVGTPAYMSPEQARGEPVDARTDIFAFGTVLVEALTGKNPFQRLSVAQTLSAILSAPPDLRAVPPQFMALAQRCLEEDPKRRYQTATELAEALRDALTRSNESRASEPAEPEGELELDEELAAFQPNIPMSLEERITGRPAVAPSVAIPAAEGESRAYSPEAAEPEQFDDWVVRVPPAYISPALPPDVPQPPPPHTGGGGGGGIGEPPPERRYLEATFLERVRLGGSEPLDVRIAVVLPEKGVHAAFFDLPIPEGGVSVKLSVHATNGFRVTPSLHTIVVKRGQDSDWVQFVVEAVRPGVQRLDVIAYVDGRQAGTLRIESAVDEIAATSGPFTARGDVDSTRRPAGDVTLEILYDKDANTYRYKWIDFDQWVQSDEIPHKLTGVPHEQVNALISGVNDIARGRAGLSAAGARTLLAASGSNLWRQLIPKKLNEEFWSRRDKIKRLLLRPINDEIPWELLYPTDGGDAGFLVEQFVVSRWSALRQMPSVIEMSRGEAVVPPGSPPTAMKEIESIGDVLKPRTALGRPIDNFDVLLRCLSQAQFQLLHFACHNTYSTSGSAGIRFGGANFTPLYLARNTFSGPLVFINACRTDAKESTFIGVSSWADMFIDRGAGAFIGTLWDVRDQSASRFAKSFYEAMAKDIPLGDAVMAARQTIKDGADPTWLAYTMYGDPGAMVRR